MHKKKKTSLKKADVQIAHEPSLKSGIKRSLIFPFLSYEMEMMFLFLLASLLYANTFLGDYVLDDIMSVSGNKFVLMGFAGIKNIFTTDSLFGFVDSLDSLQGGRYRPLALMSFAIEIGLWGKNPHISHLINIIIWVFSSLSVFYLLRNFFFKNQPDVAFIAAIIFIIHPIHTEVVANIKSRDELLSFLFLILSTITIFKFINQKQPQKIFYVMSLIFYLMALLSKENGVTFILLLPLMLYVFSNKNPINILKLSWPYLIVLAIFVFIRYKVIGINTNVSEALLNNPFLHATPATRLATIIYCLLKYIGLLFFPYPQSYDYSFNQIPITDFSNPFVLLSIVLYASLFIYALINLKSKNVIAFCIMFYFISIFIVSNILVDIGALLGERFLYQPSFAFAICIGYFIVWISQRIKWNITARNAIVVGFLLVLISIFGYRTIKRNHDWNTEYNLYLNDVKVSPNSAVANNYAGIALVNYADKNASVSDRNIYLEKALPYFKKASQIFTSYPEAYSNAAIAMTRLGKLEQAEGQLANLRNVNSESSKLHELDKFIANKFYERGASELSNKNNDQAVYNFEKAVEHDSTEAQYWFNVAGSNCMIGNFKRGYYALTKCIQLKPDYKEAQMGLEDLKSKGINSAE